MRCYLGYGYKVWTVLPQTTIGPVHPLLAQHHCISSAHADLLFCCLQESLRHSCIVTAFTKSISPVHDCIANCKLVQTPAATHASYLECCAQVDCISGCCRRWRSDRLDRPEIWVERLLRCSARVLWPNPDAAGADSKSKVLRAAHACCLRRSLCVRALPSISVAKSLTDRLSACCLPAHCDAYHDDLASLSYAAYEQLHRAKQGY